MYKIVYLQSKKHHFEESGWEEEFNSLFPYKQTESDNTLVKKKTKTKHSYKHIWMLQYLTTLWLILFKTLRHKMAIFKNAVLLNFQSVWLNIFIAQ